MRRTKAFHTFFYWLSQVLWWSVYAVCGIVIHTFYNAGKLMVITDTRTLKLNVISGVSIMSIRALAGITLTHLFREYAHRRQWLDYSFRELLPRVVAASIILAFIMFLFAQTFTDWNFRLLSLHPGGQFLQLAKMTEFLLIHSFWFCLWMVLYFGVHAEQRIRRQKIEFWKLQATLQESQLLALKAQINPHFLFNALNSIQELMSEDMEKARTAIVKLSSVLRYAMRSGDQALTTIQQEMEIVSSYLDIERIRFDDRLQTAIQIEAEVLPVVIPPMMIQTMVENAVKHGIARLEEGGIITIKAMHHSQDEVIVEITNDGKLDKAQSSNNQAENGLGIRNTQERLRLLYGDAATFSLEEYGLGTETQVITRICIPFRTNQFSINHFEANHEHSPTPH